MPSLNVNPLASLGVVAPEEMLPRLIRYRMLPQFLREMVIDQAIAEMVCPPEEAVLAQQQFCQKYQLNTEPEIQAWLARYGIPPEQFAELAVRELKLERFKQQQWEHKVEPYFLQVKSRLDKVVYSLLRTQDIQLAQELYFRIQEGEQTFAELAQVYSEGPEAHTGGLLGPVSLATPHPILAQLLMISQPGQIWSPKQVGEWFVIVRLEKLIPAKLDEATKQQLLNELFEAWVQEQLTQTPTVNA